MSTEATLPTTDTRPDKSDAITKREQYERTRGALWREKASWDPLWRELAEFVKPKRLRAYPDDRNKGDRRNGRIIDSTASFAHRTLSSGMHAGMSSPARPFFSLSVPDDDLSRFKPVRAWLDVVTKLMLSVMIKANTYTALPIAYGDLGLFGTHAMGVLEDDRELFRCYPYPLGTYALGISKRQTVDTFVRDYQLSVGALVDEFGRETKSGAPDWSVFSKTVKDLYEGGNYQELVDVCWIVAPNPDADPDKLASKYLPTYSCHFEKGTDDRVFLREAGYSEFPILAPRWEVQAEDVYGSESPGQIALGDIKSLQTMTRRKAQAVEKMINPPMQAPTHLKALGLNILPGGVNYADILQGQQKIEPIHEVRLPIGEIREDIGDVRYLIRRAFFEDLFLMLAQTDRREITAREVEERHEEKLLALGPVLERSNDELLEPMINRLFMIMGRAGMIPEPPPDIEGQEMKVEFVSIMAQAQKMVSIAGLDRFVGTMLPLAQSFPQLNYKLNLFGIADEYADAFGVPARLVIDDEEAQAGLDAAQQAAAEAQQAESMATAAGAMRDLSSADVTKDNALTAVLKGAQQ